MKISIKARWRRFLKLTALERITLGLSLVLLSPLLLASACVRGFMILSEKFDYVWSGRESGDQ